MDRTFDTADLDDLEAETVVMNFTVSNARPIDSKTLFALVDVEVAFAGIAFEILGVQARREPDGCTSIRLPTYKDPTDAWLPAETHAPLADAVLAFLLEEGQHVGSLNHSPVRGDDLRCPLHANGVDTFVAVPLEALRRRAGHHRGLPSPGSRLPRRQLPHSRPG